MARKSKSGSDVNKSQAIREYLSKNPNAKPKQILETLTAEGVSDLSTTFISTIKTKFGKSGGKQPGRRGRPPGKAGATKRPAASAAGKSAGGLSLDALLKARNLVRELGGIENAQSALQALAEIME